MPKPKIVFMGTPEFAVSSLKQLLESDYRIEAVYTQPPRPAGRGQSMQLSSVHLFAQAHHLKVLTPTTLKDADTQAEFQAHECDFAVVAAYGLILPKAILQMPRWGCINIHASLLPRWRGAAPIQRALLAGDLETGITIMQMDEGLDTGDIVLKESLAILPMMTASILRQELAHLGAKLIEPALEGLQDGSLTRYAQPVDGVIYASKVDKNEAILDWTQPAQLLERRVRAFDIWPGVTFEWQGQKIKVLQAAWESLPESEPSPQPGKVVDAALLIACGCDALRLIELQKPGKGPLKTKDFLNGTPIPAGTFLKLLHDAL